MAQSGHTTLRALAQANVFLVQSPGRATLEPIRPGDLPAAETGQTAGVDWVKQTIPGDPDWPGMTFAVALAQDGTRKTVAVVTSREAADPVAAAVKLAGDTLRADDAATIRRHEEIWSDFWSRSGVRLEDSFLTATWYRNLYFLRCVTKPGVVSPGLVCRADHRPPGLARRLSHQLQHPADLLDRLQHEPPRTGRAV